MQTALNAVWYGLVIVPLALTTTELDGALELTLNWSDNWLAGKEEALVNSVPVLSGNVSVRSVLLFGEAIVKMPVPLALPASDTLLMLALPCVVRLQPVLVDMPQ